jgi:hypothetical protein
MYSTIQTAAFADHMLTGMFGRRYLQIMCYWLCPRFHRRRHLRIMCFCSHLLVVCVILTCHCPAVFVVLVLIIRCHCRASFAAGILLVFIIRRRAPFVAGVLVFTCRRRSSFVAGVGVLILNCRRRAYFVVCVLVLCCYPNFDFAIKTKVRWSKNVHEERKCPDQILLGSMDARTCVIFHLAIYLEEPAGYVVLHRASPGDKGGKKRT